MRIKAFFIYIGLGAAFLAVSLWVFLSGGKNARAIRAKYKLGGMMLSAWAMMSAASCTVPGPFVTCYEPAPPDPPEIMCYDVAEEHDIVRLEGTAFSRGQEVAIVVQAPNYFAYAVQIYDGEKNVLQEERFQITSEYLPEQFSFLFTFDGQLPAGDLFLAVKGVYSSENEEELINLWSTPITLE